MTTEYLGVKQVAERLGITSGGLLNLKLPEPDATIGRTRGWLPETIDEWNAHVRDVVSEGETTQEQSIDTRKPSHMSWFFDTNPLTLCGHSQLFVKSATDDEPVDAAV